MIEIKVTTKEIGKEQKWFEMFDITEERTKEIMHRVVELYMLYSTHSESIEKIFEEFKDNELIVALIHYGIVMVIAERAKDFFVVM